MNKSKVFVKVFISLFISLVFVFSLTLPAFADNAYNLIIDEAPGFESKYDSRNEGVVTCSKIQDGRNCWVYAGISAVETDAIKQGIADKNIDLSERFITYFAAGSKTGDRNSKYGGNVLRFCTVAAACNEFALESDFSVLHGYTENDRYKGTSGIGVREYRKLNSLSEIKSWVKEHGSAVLTFGDIAECKAESIYRSDSVFTTGHAVCIVGWDDNYSASLFDENPPADGAFIIKNSAGASWGDNGFGYASYYDATITGVSGITAKKLNDKEYTYTYNQTSDGCRGTYGENITTVNSYTMKDNGIIDSYTFCVATSGVTISSSVLVNGEVKYTDNPRVYKEGMFRVNTGEIAVNADDVVNIEVSYIFSGTYMIPAEINYTDGVEYNSNTGESFYKLQNGEYTDSNANNFYINLNVINEDGDNNGDICVTGNFFNDFITAIVNFFNNIAEFFKEVFNGD